MSWYPLEKNTGRLGEGADVICKPFSIVSGSPDMRTCRADTKSVRKTFLRFSSHKLMVSVAFSSARTSAL